MHLSCEISKLSTALSTSVENLRKLWKDFLKKPERVAESQSLTLTVYLYLILDADACG